MFAIATASPAYSPAGSFAIPRAREAVWVERLLWMFMLSFAFDYRAGESRSAGAGAGLDQLIFLAGAVSSTLGILFLGYRYLLVRPGAWVVLGYGSFLVYMVGNSLLQGVVPGHCLRIVLPLLLCYSAMLNAHIAGCMGIRPSQIVKPVFVAACINILWRIVQGFAFKDVTLENSRFAVQSAVNSWLAAWIGCSILLRKKFHWSLLVGCAVLFTGVAVTVTRSLLIPATLSLVVAGLCFLSGCRRGVYRITELPKRLLPFAAVGGFLVIAIGMLALVLPDLLERWDERLFHPAADRNTVTDTSVLTRLAEVRAYREILSADPLHYINGKGIGASYYWHSSYLPEIRVVYDPEPETAVDLWFAGHCTWTYSMFSGGAIALCFQAALFGGVMLSSLRAANANASHPDEDHWLAYLPFVATIALLSETITSNPFEDRLAGIFFGVMAGLPQAFLVRASWLHSSSRSLNPAP